MALTYGFTFSPRVNTQALAFAPVFTAFSPCDLHVFTVFTRFHRDGRTCVYAYEKAYTRSSANANDCTPPALVVEAVSHLTESRTDKRWM